MFGEVPDDVSLKVTKTKTYKFGIVQVHFKVVKKAPT